MTTKELLKLDWREKENRKVLSKALKMIPPLKEVSDMNRIQKALHIMCNKYDVHINIEQDPVSGDGYDIWCCYIYGIHNINKVYGICLDELFTKIVIAIYSEVRKRKVKTNE